MTTHTVTVIAPPPPPDPPTASFTDSEHGLTVKLVDTSGAATVTWSLGNGENASGPNVTTTYAKPGSYVVIETVIDEHGLVSEAVREIIVARLPRLLGKLSPLG